MYIKGYNPAFEVVCVAQRINKKKKEVTKTALSAPSDWTTAFIDLS